MDNTPKIVNYTAGITGAEARKGEIARLLVNLCKRDADFFDYIDILEATASKAHKKVCKGGAAGVAAWPTKAAANYLLEEMPPRFQHYDVM
jgi:hypothetical protein